MPFFLSGLFAVTDVKTTGKRVEITIVVPSITGFEKITGYYYVNEESGLNMASINAMHLISARVAVTVKKNIVADVVRLSPAILDKSTKFPAQVIALGEVLERNEATLKLKCREYVSSSNHEFSVAVKLSINEQKRYLNAWATIRVGNSLLLIGQLEQLKINEMTFTINSIEIGLVNQTRNTQDIVTVQQTGTEWWVNDQLNETDSLPISQAASHAIETDTSSQSQFEEEAESEMTESEIMTGKARVKRSRNN